MLASWGGRFYSRAMKILLSSYSFGAHRGSEAGVGWNVAQALASRGHQVWVITTSEFSSLNHAAIQGQSWAHHLHILEWDCGLSEFPLGATYRSWQRLIREPLRELHEREQFDLIHHLTFNQYRGVEDVFHIDIPHLLGPLGGAETIAPVFWKELPLKSCLKEWARYVTFDALPLIARMRRMSNKGLLLFSGPQTLRRIQKLSSSLPLALSPIIAIHEEEIVTETVGQQGDYLICAAGGGRPEKGVDLTLQAFAQYRRQGGQLRLVIAAVPPQLTSAMASRIREQGLDESSVELLPFIPREELLSLMRCARAFLCLNFRDSGCMALLEALALGLPSICFDNPEQFWLPAEFACKIPVRQKKLLSAITNALHEQAAAPPRPHTWHERRIAWLRRDMTWEARVNYLEECYRYLLDPKESSIPQSSLSNS